MFEFHGWAVIELPEENHFDGFRKIGGPVDQAIKRVRTAVNEVHDEMSIFEVRPSSNGQIVVYAHGLRNHRYEPVIELFKWLGREFPLAYGLLYVQDGEDQEREADFSNVFRVWRLARGKVEETADSFLSPRIPTIEP